MKKIILAIAVVLALTACDNNSDKEVKEETPAPVIVKQDIEVPIADYQEELKPAPVKEETAKPAPIKEGAEQVALYDKLCEASKNGNLQEVKKLIAEGADVNYLKIREDFDEYYEMTPLMLAGRGGHLEVVKELIKAGANLDQITLAVNRCPEPGDDFTVLEMACPKYMDVVTELAKAGANARSILYCAAITGNLDLLNTALEKGADVNGTYGQGFSPLMLSAKEGHKDFVTELIKAGADVNYSNDEYGEKYSVLNAAASYPEIVKILEDAGAKE